MGWLLPVLQTLLGPDSQNKTFECHLYLGKMKNAKIVGDVGVGHLASSSNSLGNGEGRSQERLWVPERTPWACWSMDQLSSGRGCLHLV